MLILDRVTSASSRDRSADIERETVPRSQDCDESHHRAATTERRERERERERERARERAWPRGQRERERKRVPRLRVRLTVP